MSYTITEKCNGCGACARICPAVAISGEKKKPHTIDANLCIECGACGRICPQSAVLDAEGASVYHDQTIRMAQTGDRVGNLRGLRHMY